MTSAINHNITVKFNRIAQHDTYFNSAQNNPLPEAGRTFFTPYSIHSRSGWKSGLIDHLLFPDYKTLQRTDDEHSRLFSDSFAKDI